MQQCTSRKLSAVRSVDIANEQDFKKSSVSVAMKNLREKKHILADQYVDWFIERARRTPKKNRQSLRTTTSLS